MLIDKNYKKKWAGFLCFIMSYFFVVCSFAGPSVELFKESSFQPVSELSPARAIEVSVVKGKELPQMTNEMFSKFSLRAVSGNELMPIPFQFDDINERGFLYAQGGKLKIVGQPGVMEDEDELSFMYKDAGMKASSDLLASIPAKAVAEIELKEGGHSRYVYLFEDDPARSEVSYTSFDREKGLIKTAAYSQKVNPKNLLVWEDFTYENYEEERSILDTMKLRLKANMGFLHVTLHNGLIPNRVVAVREGPVRTVIEVDAGISVFGIQVATAGASVLVSENTFQFPVYVTIPKVAAPVLKNALIEISLDFDEQEGMRFRSELGPKEPITAGRSGGDADQYQVDLEHNWLTASSGRGWDIIALFNRDERVDLTLGSFFRDQSRGDKADKPERVPGSYPQVGYTVKDVPAGVEAIIGIDLFYSPDFWQGNQVEFAIHEIKHPVPVFIVGL